MENNFFSFSREKYLFNLTIPKENVGKEGAECTLKQVECIQIMLNVIDDNQNTAKGHGFEHHHLFPKSLLGSHMKKHDTFISFLSYFIALLHDDNLRWLEDDTSK